MVADNVPVLLFRVTHDDMAPISPYGISAESPNARPTQDLLRKHLKYNGCPGTCWSTFTTWNATCSRLESFVSYPNNLRLHAVLTHALKDGQVVQSSIDMAASCSIPFENYMKGEYLIQGFVPREACLIFDLPLDDRLSLAYVPVEVRYMVHCPSPTVPGILTTVPNVLVKDMPNGCFLDWFDEFGRKRGHLAGRDLCCFLDAISTQKPKTLADFKVGDFGAPISPALFSIQARALKPKDRQPVRNFLNSRCVTI